MWALAVAVLLVASGLFVSGAATPARASAAPAADPATTSGFTATGPTRIADTRKPKSPTNGLSGEIGPGETRDLKVVGMAGVPVAGTTAVVLNVTAVAGNEASDLRVWPAGEPTPGVSNLNWSPEETVPNLVTVRVGADGRVSLRNQSGTVHVVVDLQGWFGPDGDGLLPIGPVRIADSRKPGAGLCCVGLETGIERVLRVAGEAGVPVDASAVVVNLTVTGGDNASDLRVWASGEPAPQVSNLNWPEGDTRANLAVVPIGDDGRISLRNAFGTVEVIVDVVGAFTPAAGDRFTATDPFRSFDTRKTASPLVGAFAAGQVRDLTVATDPVPADATAVVMNLTVVGGTAASDLRAWPTGDPVPGVSNLNWPPGATRPNLAVVPIGDDGKISLRNQSGAVHVIGDVVGWFTEEPLPANPGAWTDISDTLPTIDGLDLHEISCVGDRFCMAAGERTPAGGEPGDRHAVALVWDGSRWREVASPSVAAVATDPEFGGPNSDSVLSVSCASPTSCGLVIAHSYDDDDPQYVSVWDGSTWNQHLITNVPVVFHEVVCTSDGRCTTFGETNVRWDGVSWGFVGSSAFDPVVCVTWDACVGTDLVWDGAAEVSVMATWTGATASAAPAPGGLPDDLVGVAGACTAASDCLFLGQGGAPLTPVALEWDGTAWEHGPALPSTFDEWRAGSCASPAECVAVVDSDGSDTTVRWADGAWTEAAAAPHPDFSCTSGSCMAVGTGDGGAEAWIFLADGTTWQSPGAWTDITATLPESLPDRGISGLDQVSCVSDTFCMASGLASGAGPAVLDPPRERPVVVVWDGTQWSEVAAPVATDRGVGPEARLDRQRIADLSCATPTHCGAFLQWDLDDDEFSYAAMWDGTSWTIASMGEYWGDSFGVECTSDGYCVFTDDSFVHSWDGETWSDGGGDGPIMLEACVSRSWCVGEGYDVAVLAGRLGHWDGTAFVVDPAPPHDGWRWWHPNFVEGTCASTSDCILFGITPWNHGTSPLVWDGVEWTHGDIPAGLLGWAQVSCATPDDCLAVGTFTDGDRTLRYDGSGWRDATDHPLFRPRYWRGAHGALSCVTGMCMAVGSNPAGDVATPMVQIYLPSGDTWTAP